MAPEAGDRELGCIRTCRFSSSSFSSSSSSSHPIPPSHPIPFQPISSHPTPSHIPSHHIPFHPIPSHPIPLSPPGPSSEKLTTFWKLFRTRSCTDIIYTFAQKRPFLQRRKSVCKRSRTVRGMRPPQGPACVRICLRIRDKKTKKRKKT